MRPCLSRTTTGTSTRLTSTTILGGACWLSACCAAAFTGQRSARHDSVSSTHITRVRLEKPPPGPQKLGDHPEVFLLIRNRHVPSPRRHQVLCHFRRPPTVRSIDMNRRFLFQHGIDNPPGLFDIILPRK